MAKSLELDVIAEGVETVGQAAFLRNERCEEAQGFLYGKPLSGEDFAAYLNVVRIAGMRGGGRPAEARREAVAAAVG
jgi:sensor c-di-GMP phosphodiesterase-like protein